MCLLMYIISVFCFCATEKSHSVFICKHYKQDTTLQDKMYACLFIHAKLVVCFLFCIGYRGMAWEKRRYFSCISFQVRELAIMYAHPMVDGV
jgi:hypothetical protein